MWQVEANIGHGRNIQMNETMFVTFCISLVAIVVLRPNKIKIKISRKSSDASNEVCIDLDNNKKES